MKDALTTHTLTEQFTSVIFAKKISTTTQTPVVSYTHRDKYSIFGMVTSGECKVEIDFKTYSLKDGDVIYVGPGQVHSLINIHNAEAYLLFIDTHSISISARYTLEEYTLRQTILHPSSQQRDEMQHLFEILVNRIAYHDSGEDTKAATNDTAHRPDTSPVVQHTANAISEIAAEIATHNIPTQSADKRYIKIVLALKHRLVQHDAIDRRPSNHAAALNISTTYLNEAVHYVTGTSASRFIANEVLVRAKRRLVYTPASIKEIAETLGFDDSAYFTRFFTKAEGISPATYRKKYLE